MDYNKFQLAGKVSGPIENKGTCLLIPITTINYKKEETAFEVFLINSKKYDFANKFMRPGFEGLFEGRLGNKDGRIGLLAFEVSPIKWAPREEEKKLTIADVSFDDDSTPF